MQINTLYPYKPIKSIGLHENKPKQFIIYPMKICYDDENQHIIVSDNCNHCIQLFHSKTFEFHSMFGSRGHQYNQFNSPTGICIQPFTRYLLICDTLNNRIQVLRYDDDCDYSFLYQIGSASEHKSEEKGKFNSPRGLCCDKKGHIMVLDTLNDRIQEFNESGRFLHLFGSFGFSSDRFYCPQCICYDKEYHQLLVADTSNERISIWSHDSCSKPQPLSHIQLKNICTSVCVDPLRNNQILIGTRRNVLVYDSRNHKEPIQIIGSTGESSKLGEFDYVNGLCVNEQDGTLLVVDSFRIQVF